ncbi:MAG TPA: BON domain-containing protein [Terriglobia bacterium]|nr:BON domain-containing protein [Terriglobia bacterium]
MRLARRAAMALALGCMVGLAAPALRSQSPDDATIVSDINAKLFADSVLKTRDIRVSSQGGVVTLEGSVATQLEKAAVDRIASTEPGVQKVIDSMSIAADTAPAAQSQEAPPAPAALSVPAGTVVTVRMIDSIDSGRNQPGQEFDATVDSPVVSGGQVAISKDAPAKVRLVNAATSGRIKGSAQLQLELVSITVNGSPYRVQSGYYEEHGAPRGRRTAASAGGGAVLGAMIGAIAGGGAGAAIGAGSGAAIGTGVGAAHKGSTIRVPPETKIDFTLREPLIVNVPAGTP